jgi:hypothetical protein
VILVVLGIIFARAPLSLAGDANQKIVNFFQQSAHPARAHALLTSAGVRRVDFPAGGGAGAVPTMAEGVVWVPEEGVVRAGAMVSSTGAGDTRRGSSRATC